MRVLIVNHTSLDGVMQSPARSDEDTRDDFPHGGWAVRDGEGPELGAAMSRHMGEGFSWLFGRRSYEDMLRHWNSAGGPMADGLNAATKYVASSHPDTALPWPNSTLLTGDVPAEVATLRARPGGKLVVMGSGRLAHSLLPHDLVDELLLFIHPLVLGSGLRLFGSDDQLHRFELVECRTTGRGVVIAAYRRSRPSSPATT